VEGCWKERSVIRREDDVDGQASVTTAVQPNNYSDTLTRIINQIKERHFLYTAKQGGTDFLSDSYASATERSKPWSTVFLGLKLKSFTVVQK